MGMVASRCERETKSRPPFVTGSDFLTFMVKKPLTIGPKCPVCLPKLGEIAWNPAAALRFAV